MGLPCGPVVRTPHSNAGSVGSDPGWEAKVPHASESKSQNLRQKQYHNKFSKDFKNGPQKKSKKKKKELRAAYQALSTLLCGGMQDAAMGLLFRWITWCLFLLDPEHLIEVTCS